MITALTVDLSIFRRFDQPKDQVEELQRELRRLGYYRDAIDGDFYKNTRSAVVRFQGHAGLVQDGVVGRRTRAALAAVKPTIVRTGSSCVRFRDICYGLMTGKRGPVPTYEFGYEVSLGVYLPRRLDCSEFSQWGVYQTTHITWVDGSRYQYEAIREAGTTCSVEYALNHPGHLVFISSNGRVDGIHHVAVTVGDGIHTAEAHSRFTTPQCGIFDGRHRFNLAGRVPVLAAA